MEEDDIVVQEIPVFLSQALSKHLYIYQYPIKPGTKDWNDSKVVNSLIKPNNQAVKLEFGVDTYSDKYCTSKGEQIALNTDGPQESSRYVKDREREKAQYFKSGIMDKMVYESTAPCTDSRHYAVALLQDKELHCTPLKAIVQLRPSYSYFDRQDKRSRDSDRADNSEDEEEEQEAQQVTVKFARQETEVSKKAREKSFEFVSRRNADEPWCDSVWRHSDSDHADLERLKLFCSNTGAGAALSMRGRQYVRQLVPAPPADEADSAPHGALFSMPLADQCRAILADAKLMSFGEIRQLVRSAEGSVSDTALLSALSTGGCCVRGLWAALSADVYTQPSPAAGVPPPLMCAARDYVLYLLTQSPYVDRRKIAAAVRLPPTEVLEILRTVAKFNPQTGWELFLPPDPIFEQRFPDVVQRQNLYWEAKQRQFNEMILGESTMTKRQRKKSQRESFSSDTMMSPKPRCNSTSSAHEDDDGRKRLKNKSASGTGKRTRNISSSSVHDSGS